MPTPLPGGPPPDADPEPDRTRPDIASPPEPPRSVLLIEPAPGECARLRDVLTAGGLAVHACADLAAAEDAMASVHPGVILTRRDLASGSGLELAHRRGEEPAAGWIPVILHGGHATAEERIAALDLGAFDVLAPVPGDAELLARLRAALRIRERMERLAQRAYRDGLTGLINRAALEDQLHRHWESSRRHGTTLSVLLVDVDRFKEINDTYGHAAGDDALRRTAAVLTRSVRGTDIVARYAGDEFLIVAPNCPPESAVTLAGRFRQGLAAPADPPARDARGVAMTIAITLSVGIAGTHGPAPDRLDDLLHQADEALYHAKRSGRDAVALHDPSRGGATLVARPHDHDATPGRP